MNEFSVGRLKKLLADSGCLERMSEVSSVRRWRQGHDAQSIDQTKGWIGTSRGCLRAPIRDARRGLDALNKRAG